MRAKKMKEDDVADLNVDPDETYNADEEGVLLCQKTNNNTRSHQRLLFQEVHLNLKDEINSRASCKFFGIERPDGIDGWKC